MTENYLLEVKNVSKSFGVVKALNRIDFNVRPNEIHALCGENGAGKSTLMNILSGVYPYGSYGGEVYYDGELCKFRNVRESEKKNIAIIHQHLALFPALSIAENIFLGNENAKNSVIDWKLTIRRAAELMERVGLHENPETKIRDLGVGKQQLVEICKAIFQECQTSDSGRADGGFERRGKRAAAGTDAEVQAGRHQLHFHHAQAA